jgi:hypothetical protein
MVCALGENGADITVAYCRADKLASDWSKLTSNRGTTNAPAAAKVPMTVYTFPDGSGSIGLPAGWRTGDQTCINGIHVQGPAGQRVSIRQSYSVVLPNSWLAAPARNNGFNTLLVAPYTGPVEALQNLVPELNLRSQRNGGPTIKLDKMLQPPKPVPGMFSNGQAAEVYFAFTRTTGGVSTRCRALSRIETWYLGNQADSWWMDCTELTAADATFDQDLPVMLAIVNSEKENSQAAQQAVANQIANNNRAFNAAQQANAAQQKNFEALQQIAATRQQTFDGVLKSMQHNEVVRNRSLDNFDEAIRGTRTVEDTVTGQRRDVDLGHVDEIVNKLNTREPDRYIQVPLRDKSDPLPGR